MSSTASSSPAFYRIGRTVVGAAFVDLNVPFSVASSLVIVAVVVSAVVRSCGIILDTTSLTRCVVSWRSVVVVDNDSHIIVAVGRRCVVVIYRNSAVVVLSLCLRIVVCWGRGVTRRSGVVVARSESGWNIRWCCQLEIRSVLILSIVIVVCWPVIIVVYWPVIAIVVIACRPHNVCGGPVVAYRPHHVCGRAIVVYRCGGLLSSSPLLCVNPVAVDTEFTSSWCEVSVVVVVVEGWVAVGSLNRTGREVVCVGVYTPVVVGFACKSCRSEIALSWVGVVFKIQR